MTARATQPDMARAFEKARADAVAALQAVQDRDQTIAYWQERSKLAEDQAAAWRNEHIADPEAEALSACVRAFDTMSETMRKHAGNQYGVAWSSSASVVYGTHEVQRPSALSDPVGRVLLALAARYDLEIEAKLPQPSIETGQRLVSCPADIAEQLERLVAMSGR